MTNHIMIDLETLGTKPDAHILSIAAVHFNIETGEIIDRLYQELAPGQGDRSIDFSTVLWWKKQSVEMPEGNVRLQSALINLLDWVMKIDLSPYVWANSPSFDLVILRNAIDYYGWEKTPITDHTKWMDMRTLMNLHPEIKQNMPDVGTHHNALDDCIFQVNCVVEAIKRMQPTSLITNQPNNLKS